MTDKLFDTQDIKPVEQPPKDPQEGVTYLDQLVGEGKKFTSTEDLAKGKAESDRYIDQLQTEMSGIREELNKRHTIEEFMEKINSQRPQPSETVSNQGVTKPDETPPVNVADYSGMSEEEIRRLIENQIEEERHKTVSERNLEFVRVELKKTWGEQFPFKLRDKAKELGVGEDYLQKMAEEQPKVFLTTVTAGETQVNPNNVLPPKTGTMTLLTDNNSSNVKNEAYYKQLKKDNSKLYWTPKIQNEMHKIGQEMGMDFFET